MHLRLLILQAQEIGAHLGVAENAARYRLVSRREREDGKHECPSVGAMLSSTESILGATRLSCPIAWC
jgi:hypothetical protein